MNNASTQRLVRIGMLMAFGFVLAATASVPMSAQPVLYRISAAAGTAGIGRPTFPLLVGPLTMPAPAVANLVTNGTQPASVQFNGGDFIFSSSATNPTPPTAFGIFYELSRWKVSDQPATLGPNPAFTTASAVPNGYEAFPPYFSSSPQNTIAVVSVKPGPAKFGGAWDLGLLYDSGLVVAKVGGGFRAGINNTPQWVGKGSITSNTNYLVGPYHSTTMLSSPVFSSTACPTTPATCPWGTMTTPGHQEQTGVRWTTGMATAIGPNPPITGFPPTTTLVQTGADNRTGPLSSMGTLQLVSAVSIFTRGALPAEGPVGWGITLTFLPEPGATAMLAAGILGLLMIYRRTR